MPVCLNPHTFTARYLFSHARAYDRQTSELLMGKSGSGNYLQDFELHRM